LRTVPPATILRDDFRPDLLAASKNRRYRKQDGDAFERPCPSRGPQQHAEDAGRGQDDEMSDF
jgi:hypothetical protein